MISGMHVFTYERDFLRARAAGTLVSIAEVFPYFIAGLASAPRLQDILRQGEPNSSDQHEFLYLQQP